MTARDEHTAQARAMLAEAEGLNAEDRGTPEDLSFLLEASAHAMLALVDAISELTVQASPTQDRIKARVLTGVE
ncbi:hypothetical protein ABH931_006108 [Streptacidiphilus sp. MAP12-33]|uniref:hypothetical protein n=1 Tax=Streptacidiphilus sp. MAP12-33 TaxID=3156266 RepID=UPI003513F09B